MSSVYGHMYVQCVYGHCGVSEAVIFDHVHDIAAGKPAHQSSVLGLRTANLAVDQDPQTCARTLKEKHSNWTIDLLDQHTIAGLQVDTGM